MKNEAIKADNAFILLNSYKNLYSLQWNTSNFVWTLCVKADFGVWLLDNLSPEHVTNRGPQFSHLYFLNPQKAATLQRANEAFIIQVVYALKIVTGDSVV